MECCRSPRRVCSKLHHTFTPIAARVARVPELEAHGIISDGTRPCPAADQGGLRPTRGWLPPDTPYSSSTCTSPFLTEVHWVIALLRQVVL